METYEPRKKTLDFGGNPDLDSDSGIFNGISIRILILHKSAH